MPSPTTDKETSFEQSIDRLEDIVEKIESGEVGLEEALNQYEQGQALIKRCRGILDKAEQKITELTQNADGQPAITTPKEPADGSADA